jgi:hypothetical protein
MSEKPSERKHNVAEIVAYPALAAGAGSLLGGVVGGQAARTVLTSPGISERLAKMSPTARKKLVSTLRSAGAGLAGTAGAVGSYALSEYIRDKMEKRENR